MLGLFILLSLSTSFYTRFPSVLEYNYMTLRDYKHVHCIGIGGIGLSALARYCKAQGAAVTGSDGGSSRITDDLQKEGVTVFQGHNEAHVSSSVDLVIYTIAAQDDNPELLLAKKNGITCMTYPEALGELTKEYETIAVCGTHGKTTTTAMVASALTACGESPTVIVGSLLAEHGTNFIQGSGKYLVVEACEYRRSFLNLHPTHVLVTNIDDDHLDYYKDIEDIKSAFQEFADTIPKGGTLVMHDDVLLRSGGFRVRADAYNKDSIALSVLGEHNRSNAQLVLALTNKLGLDQTKVREGLKSFSGTWRRMEYKGEYQGASLYDDYGHHPTEIRATLQAIREKYPIGEYTLITFFMPHLYSRTKEHLHEWGPAFAGADTACILPIYAAREAADDSITSEMVVDTMTNGVYMPSFDDAVSYIREHAKENTVVLTIGAGDMYKIIEMVKES